MLHNRAAGCSCTKKPALSSVLLPLPSRSSSRSRVPVPHRSLRVLAYSHGHGDLADLHEAKLGPNVVASVKELRDPAHVQWSQATVLRNEAMSFDGSVRCVHLSVVDHVDVLYGRKIKGKIDTPRWLDSYTMPGQFVGLRFPSSPDGSDPSPPKLAKRLYSIASSPYESRRDSYGLDASIIEVVADRGGSEDDHRLSELGPGAVVEVTQVVGRGFCSLLNTVVNVQSALETGRPLLLIAVGTRGMAPIRAMLNWTPVLAHATRHKVTTFFVTRSSTTAAFISEWDTWREAGVNFSPIYTEMFNVEPRSASPGGPIAMTAEQHREQQEQVLEALDKALFLREGGFSSVAGARSQDAVVLMSGLTGDASAQLTKRMSAKGVEQGRILFCDYF